MVCVPVICSCVSNPRTVSIPEHYSDPARNVLCPRCNAINDTVYKVDRKRCYICFCCCIPCGHSNPYLACSRCGHNIGNIEIIRCRKCGVGTSCRSNFCPNCGERK
ncbi:uncharacterized protein VICG_00973 [Vittaforma corneae ATCC 50505]|uniref:Zinc-ribbon 15 domain-containing protein n=1 Tax=Vittaforma corneae (strain ATCC 50505) TaxID=993615 RepID=L2GM85_VITCO|nr:uncharacterized protein VICG_00973 [Vittaforma corneae ATCC 50505]ELA41956.1 hypothetical protein VICG_00973 [Vittaforma corneae ATCC 50505]